MSGVTKTMYTLRAPYTIPQNIELPTNMYKLQKIQSVGENTSNPLGDIQDKVKKILKSSCGEILKLEKRWENVLMQLQEMKEIIASIKDQNKITTESKPTVSKSKVSVPNQLEELNGAVINANPSTPPYSLLLVRKLFKDSLNLNISCHTHSTVPTADLVGTEDFNVNLASVEGATPLNITLIWKQGLLDLQLALSPWKNASILGEVNILRYLARLGLQNLNYDESDETKYATDAILDLSHRLVHAKTAKEKSSITKNLNAKLGKSLYFGGDDLNISDIAVWSALKQTNLTSSQDLPPNVEKWFKRFDALAN